MALSFYKGYMYIVNRINNELKSSLIENYPVRVPFLSCVDCGLAVDGLASTSRDWSLATAV